MKLRRTKASLIIITFLTAVGWSQTPTGGIEGVVTDPSGAVVPDAKVTVIEPSTGRTLRLTTNSAGLYSARNLVPSIYSVRVEAGGFASKELRYIKVDTGSLINGNIALEIGRTGDVIQVEAESVAVDTSRQTVDTIINEKEIKSLPLFSRNFMDLAILAPGVTIRDGEAIDPTKAFAYRAVSIAGRSGTGTRVQIDGIDVTDETVGTTTANISNEAVSQFQVARSSLDISTSLTSSGAVNVISNTGSNALHGSWFYDYYNQDMGARLQYQPEADPFNRKRTGGSVGWRLLKDKLFWYANWEKTWQQTNNIVRTPEFPQFNIAQGFPTNLQYVLGKLDWNVSQSVRMFYKFQHNDDLSTGGSAISPFANVDWTNSQAIGFDLTKAHSTNAVRFGFNKFHNRIDSQELGTKFLRSGGVPVQLNVGPISWGPNGLAPQATYQTNYQLAYDGSYVWNKHTFRYGISYTRIGLGGFANFAGPLSVSGVFDDATIKSLSASGVDVKDPTNFPLDTFSMGPANGFFTLAPGHNLPHGGHINNRTGWWVGDTFKAARNFTLNVGLRYEYDSGYFNNDRRVKRDPILDTWGRGYSQFPDPPKNMYSPSIGFAWDPSGKGKTSIRGGFYRAYEMNIFNNLMFDEFANLPAGIGPDAYDITNVTTPNGTPINIDGKHPEGDYTDWQGLPIKQILPNIVALNNALQAAYAGYQFDPSKGDSYFRTSKGVTYGGLIPGNQFKAPYSLQFNIGVQRELKPGTVVSVDYIHNHGIGLPFFLVDFERRRDASTLNVANATSRMNGVLKGASVDEYIAAHPTANIGAFGLANDSVFQGLTPDYNRARFFQGGFTRYRALQVSLRGRGGTWRWFRENSYQVAYAYGISEASGAVDRAEFLAGPLDNRKPNSKATFGSNGLDYRHIFSAAYLLQIPGGVRLNSFWRFRSWPAQTLTVPNLGGATSSSNGIFGTDINGDGGTGSGSPRGDLFPGTNAGDLGRSIKSVGDLNKAIVAFNQNYAGKLTPAGQALVSAGLFSEAQLRRLGAVIPTVPNVPSNMPNPFHDIFTTDLRIDRPIAFRERTRITPFADIINLFNHAPSATYGGLGGKFGALNYDYSTAPQGQQASDLTSQRGRLSGTRLVQVGIRVDF